jgi:replicative DNA helicase Mcm
MSSSRGYAERTPSTPSTALRLVVLSVVVADYNPHMSTPDHATQPQLTDRGQTFLANYYKEEIATLAQRFPRTQKSLVVDFSDLSQHAPDLAEDLVDEPELIIEALEHALSRVEIPAEVDVSGAHVRISNLRDAFTYYPGELSPSDDRDQLRAVQGEISKATQDYAEMEDAAFECQRCGTMTRIPQRHGDWQEPHECQGCERQGPFRINYDQSAFVDAQKLQLQTPPEEAQGEGEDIVVFVEDDYADVVSAGDRVTITGIPRLEQQGSGTQPKNKFALYLEGVHIDITETDAEDVDLSPEERARIEQLANGSEGDPLELAAETLSPKIYGYEKVKKAIVLALVGGARTEYDGGDFDRGEFHILLIGDPSTAKSKLVQRAEQVGWRSVGVSGRGATVAGVTATAVQDDFGDGSWSLEAGAAVKAHRGVLAVDELDDMPAEVRSALLEPMSKQTIHITKGGVNTHLQTRCAVIAAANPSAGRFNHYEPIAPQFDFESNLMSRFDLVFTFTDVPDEEEDDKIAKHILQMRDAAKRKQRGDDLEDAPADPTPPIDPETLRGWIALAKKTDPPVYANDEIERKIRERFVELRGMYGYSDDDPVPVAFRSLEGIVRVAEAAARFEFSDTIEERHVEIATELVGKSMQDAGKDPETGELDADIKETGMSKSQKVRKEQVRETIQELQAEHDERGVPEADVVDALGEYDESIIREDIRILKEERGVAIEPKTHWVEYIGEY